MDKIKIECTKQQKETLLRSMVLCPFAGLIECPQDVHKPVSCRELCMEKNIEFEIKEGEP